MDEENLMKTDFEEFAVHTWAVWKERQTFLHGDRGCSMAANVFRSSVFLQDLHHANTTTSDIGASKNIISGHNWLPPVIGSLKLNTDACVNLDLNQFSVGG